MYGGGQPPPHHGYHRGSHYAGSAYPPSYGGGYGGYSSSVRHPPPYSYGAGYDSLYGGPPRYAPPHTSSSYRSTSPGRHPAPSSRSLNDGGPPPPGSDPAYRRLDDASPRPSSKNDSPSGPDKTSGSSNNNAAGTIRASPTQSPETTPGHGLQSSSPTHNALPDQFEVERLRAAAAEEITTAEVKPIQTDFHFFVKEKLEEIRVLAEEEVRKSLTEKGGGGGTIDELKDLDPVLVNSNINTRLMRAWEDLSKDDRDSYMVQEEDDRRRFMEEDEIASRHCATLTARGKSPRMGESLVGSKHDQEQLAEELHSSPASSVDNGEQREEDSDSKTVTTPDRDLPKAKLHEDDGHYDEKKQEERFTHKDETDMDGKATIDAGPPNKRPFRSVPEGAGEPDGSGHQSPTKRIKTEAAEED